MWPMVTGIATGGTPNKTVWVGLVPEVGKFVMQLFENDKPVEHAICCSLCLEHAEAEAATKWPEAESINGMYQYKHADQSWD